MEIFKKVVKTIGIIILILAVMAVAGGLFYIKFNQSQLELLNEESTKISEMDLVAENIDMDIKTKGSYAVVEETMKSYIEKLQNVCNDVIKICDESDVGEILSSENIEKDGPDFTETKSKIENFQIQINGYLSEVKELLKEDNILSEINDKSISEQYKELYKKLMLEQNFSNLSSAQLELEANIEELDKTLNTLNDILDFLSENSKYWEINDGKIEFNNINKLTEYYQFLNKISTEE